jgi:hypothetical protein
MHTGTRTFLGKQGISSALRANRRPKQMNRAKEIVDRENERKMTLKQSPLSLSFSLF